MNKQYQQQLRIWVVGVRTKEKGSEWSRLWKPTTLQWFNTRRACWDYITYEIPRRNFDWLEYKPLRYGPWSGNA